MNENNDKKSIVTSCGKEIKVCQLDYNKYHKYYWHIDVRSDYAFYYSYHGKKKKRIYLHEALMEREKGYVIDHVDRDRLNNYRCQCLIDGKKKCDGGCEIPGNLRIITYAENSRNRRKTRGNSKYKGVDILTGSSKLKFRASIGFNYKKIIIGVFDDEEIAALAYDVWARKLDPEHFITNFPEDHFRILELMELLDSNLLYRPALKNHRKVTNNINSYRGVKKLHGKNSYGAFINYKGKRFKLFSSIEPSEAARAWDSAIRILYPHKYHMMLNLPEVEPIAEVEDKARKILEEYGPKDIASSSIIVSDSDRPASPAYKGVTISGDKFYSRIWHKKKQYNLGSYDTAREAAQAYNRKKIEFLGINVFINDLDNPGKLIPAKDNDPDIFKPHK